MSRTNKIEAGGGEALIDEDLWAFQAMIKQLDCLKQVGVSDGASGRCSHVLWHHLLQNGILNGGNS
jgi:hypothetical protein